MISEILQENRWAISSRVDIDVISDHMSIVLEISKTMIQNIFVERNEYRLLSKYA
jgi:hypothetical protein